MSRDVSRAHWVVPVQGLITANSGGTARMVACDDGTVALYLSSADTQVSVRLDVSRAAQLSTGIWEAAGTSQQLTNDLTISQPARPLLPRLPTRSNTPAGNLVSAPPPGFTTPRRKSAGIGRGPAVVSEGAAMEAEQARTFGARLHRIRTARDKSLRVIAELAGMGHSTLHRIEHGERAVSLSEVIALAGALEIAPSELTKLPVPAPANGHTDSITEAIRLALDGIDADSPDGVVLPVMALREQVTQIHAQHRACQFVEVATDLPGLIRNLHTTLATGTDHAELLDLAVYLHVHVTRQWLIYAGAPTDLARRTVFLARRLSQERNETTTLAMAEFAVVDALLAGGALELGRTKLDSIALPPTTTTTTGLVGFITAYRALTAVLERRYGDAAAPLDAADDLIEHFGGTHNVDPLGFSFGPLNVGLARMLTALEAHKPDQVTRIAHEVDPQRNPFLLNRSLYWAHLGSALAQLRGRHADAVRALRRAESIFPTMVLRNRNVRDAIAMLLPSARNNEIGIELRRMAHRAGIPE